MRKKIDNNSEKQNSKEKFEALFRKGSDLLHQGKDREAVPFLEQAHHLKPEHFDASLNLSGAYILTRKFKKAVALLEKLRDQAPENVMVWTNLGAAYLGNPVLAHSDEQIQAIAAFEQALILDPDAPNVAYNIGLIYRDRQENAVALSWFKRALQANPNDRDAQNLISKLNEAQS